MTKKTSDSEKKALSKKAQASSVSEFNVFGGGPGELWDYSKFYAAKAKASTTAIFPLTESKREGDDWFSRGLIAWEEGRSREAFEAWKQARLSYLKRTKFKGGDAETHYRLFDIAFRMGDQDECEQFFHSAMDLYERELSFNPSKNKIIYERMAEMCGKMGDNDQQVRYQKEARQITERGFGSYFAPF